MFFELVGTIVAGAAAALMFWAVNRALGGRLPRWLMPVVAGAAMLAAAISSEYGWFARTQATMPSSFVVAQSIKEKAFWRPWTYAIPFVTRFVAVDQASVQTHPDQPGQRLVTLVFYGRWARTASVPMLFDCGQVRQADIVDGVEFGDNGEILGAKWQSVSADDPVFETACSEA
ncbi:MAG: hypothetical protein AAF636_09110 [Pseudomonadota bacterium]